MSWIEEVFAPVEAVNREIVYRHTWGHLAPEPCQKYKGWIIVAEDCFGGSTIFDYDFDDLPDSPWLAQDLSEFALAVPREKGLYKWEGWYKRFRNGKCMFGGGKFRKVEIAA